MGTVAMETQGTQKEVCVLWGRCTGDRRWEIEEHEGHAHLSAGNRSSTSSWEQQDPGPPGLRDCSPFSAGMGFAPLPQARNSQNLSPFPLRLDSSVLSTPSWFLLSEGFGHNCFQEARVAFLSCSPAVHTVFTNFTLNSIVLLPTSCSIFPIF